MEKYDHNDPVIAAELEGKQPQIMNADAYYAQPAGQNQATFNEENSEESRSDPGFNYGTIAQGSQPYPTKPDNFVAGIVRNEEKQREKSWRCLDCFTKLRGEDERQDFMAKVFGILTCQIALTTLFIVGVMLNEGIRDYLQKNMWVYWTCFGLTIAILCVIMCFKSVGRVAPWNYIACFLFTSVYSVMIATITSFYTPESVFICAIMTFVMFFTLVVIALVTKRSFGMMATLSIVGLVLCLCTLPLIIFFTGRWVIILVSVIGLIAACIFVLVDIDMITEKHGLDYDEYVFASIQLYLDIIMIFVYLLALFGDRS